LTVFEILKQVQNDIVFFLWTPHLIRQEVWRTQNDKKWFVRAFPALLPMFLYWSSLLDIKNRIVVVKLAWHLYAE